MDSMLFFEGWNEGWEDNWAYAKEHIYCFSKAYPDFDVKELHTDATLSHQSRDMLY